MSVVTGCISKNSLNENGKMVILTYRPDLYVEGSGDRMDASEPMVYRSTSPSINLLDLVQEDVHPPAGDDSGSEMVGQISMVCNTV